MKKIVVVLVLILICAGSIFAVDKDFSKMENAPVLNVEGVYIYDLKPFQKKIEDNFAFHNKTRIENITGKIFYVDTKTGEWCDNKEGYALKKFDDRDIVEPTKRVKLKKVPFFAFTVEPAGDYEFSVYAKNNDINVEIREK